MQTLIVYDSAGGNTEQIARAIGSAIGGDVTVVRASDANAAELGTIDLLIIGSPTQGGRPTAAVQNFLKQIPENALHHKNVAAFDTRLQSQTFRMFGYAAKRIADALKQKGGNLIVPPEGFYVEKPEGPLRDGEIERANSWAKMMVQ